MTTKSDRNMSMADFQQMWPGITMAPGETLTFTTTESITAPMYDTITIPKQEPNLVDGATLVPGTYKVRTNIPYPDKCVKDIESAENLIKKLMKTEAVKADSGKPDWSLVPFEALEGMVRVLEFGANKYSRNNWSSNGGFSYRRVITACIRHMFAYLRGEDNDPESGLSHIYHAQCNLLFLAMYLTNKEQFNKDDRERRAHVR